jgi:hypothetical protein
MKGRHTQNAKGKGDLNESDKKQILPHSGGIAKRGNNL